MHTSYLRSHARSMTSNKNTFLDAFLKPGTEGFAPNTGSDTKKVKKDAELLDKHVTPICLHYSEDSLSEGKEIVRGVATVDQTENIFLVSRDPLKIERKPWLKFMGTSCGSVLGPVEVPSHVSMWSQTFATKSRY